MRRILAGCVFALCQTLPQIALASPLPARHFILSVDPQGNEGISTLVINANGGSWIDGSQRCGQSHLLEHLVGREIFGRLSQNKLEIPAAVFAYTALDRITVVVVIGGGSDGLRMALEAVNIAAHQRPPEEVVAQEQRLIKDEEHQYTSFARSLSRLIASMDVDQVAQLTGVCADAELRNFAVQQRFEPFDLLIISELSAQMIGAASPKILKLYPRKTRPITLSNTPMGAAVYFNSASPSDFDSDQVIRSIGFWHWIAKTKRHSLPPRFTPVGTLGYLVYLNSYVSAKEVVDLRQAFLQVDETEWNAALRAGQITFCGNRAQRSVAPSELGYKFALDEWAQHATFNHACQALPSSTARRLAARSVPVPLASETGHEVVQTPIESMPGYQSTLRICPNSDHFPARFQGYYASIISRMVEAEFRFHRGVILSADQGEPTRSCVSIRLRGIRPPKAAIGAWLARLAKLENANDYRVRVIRAHRVQCLFLPLERRKSLNDMECVGRPKDETFGWIGDLLKYGSYEWR